MILYSMIGIALGVALMLAVRHWPIGLLFVPVCVAFGPLLFALRRTKPSRSFLVVYIVLTGLLFALMAVTGSGISDRFDPP
jgi:threonine/homoserine efflux transporter RhtA